MTRRARYRDAIAAATARVGNPDVEVRRVGAPTGAVQYACYGDGPAVLVLHGSGGGWDQGVDWARRRLPAGHRVLAVSRFGYLGSALPSNATTSGQASALAAVLDDAGVDRADVVALSAASVSALRFAVEHPDRVRSLLLESPLLPSRRRVLPPAPAVRLLARSQRLTWALTSSPLLVGLAAGVRRRDLSTTDRAELAEINATLFPLPPRVAGTLFDREVAAPEILRNGVKAEDVAAPTLVVNARRAVLATHDEAQAFVDRMPDARLLDVETGGHVLIGNVDRLRRVVAAFLDDPHGAIPE